ncbi:alpha/beta fold hydrolase [Nocardia blacklockiae]|uniref:alpha/beta fold hydrolase n=1 Tax=Nocardia blacklockiae TaxID=480036 RepID=UPI001895A2D0|nr:alpha/beta hydrolase [Nocardia blacklockiae]MBF6176602.1 alpha/beta hydrolase [Nocardia blacklockiae]
MGGSIAEFTYDRVRVGDVALNVATAGSGAPVVLLHGFPQTHLAWRHVATDLARDHRVVCPDLRGYGESDKPADILGTDTYSKRTMATDIIELMRSWGHRRFALVGHDRGGLVAFRAGLDHPEAISHVAILDVLPAADMWATLHGTAGIFAFHLYLLAQPGDIAERMIRADPDLFFGHFLDSWTRDRDAIPAAIRAEYLDAARSREAIAAVCADYRASAYVDNRHDEADRRAGRRLAMPVAALWQDPGERVLPFDPQALWSAWTTDLRTATVECGHFLPEERPETVVEAVRDLID